MTLKAEFLRILDNVRERRTSANYFEPKSFISELIKYNIFFQYSKYVEAKIKQKRKKSQQDRWEDIDEDKEDSY